jgi:hypothetical protein
VTLSVSKGAGDGYHAGMRLYTAMASLVAAALMLGGAAATALPVAAQYQNAPPPPPGYGVPVYTTWQPGWDQYQYDQRHVILGRVASFTPYRLSVMRRNGDVQTIDLKHGTVIYPTGMTPQPGMRTALVGYYSNGTFIANRVILHP